MSIPSFMSDMQAAFGLSSDYESDFRAYLGLTADQTIPNDSLTADKYIQFLSSQKEVSLSSFFLTAIQQRSGSTESVDYAALIDEFRSSMGLSKTVQINDTPDTRRQFVYFLSSPLTLMANAILGISQEASASLLAFRQSSDPSVSSTPMADNAATVSAYLGDGILPGILGQGTTPETNILIFLQDALQSFNDTSVTLDVLTKFRAYLGLSNSEAIPNDTATRAAFLNFLQEAQATVQRSEAVNAISPQEQEMRNAIFATFSIILKMLTVLQRASQVEAKSQQIYADWMSSITDQISSTPMYGPTDENSIIANSTDFGETTLGYGNITVRDMLTYLMNQIQTNNSTDESFTIKNPSVQNLTDFPNSTEMGFPKFELQKNSDGSFTFSIEAPSDVDDNGVPQSWTTVMSASVPASTSFITNQTSTSALVENLLTKMTTYWNSQVSIMTPTLTFYFPYRTTVGNISPSDLSRSMEIDLKQAWSPAASQPLYFVSTSVIPSRGWCDVYHDWSVSYVLHSGSLHDRTDSLNTVVNYMLNQISLANTLNPGSTATTYYTVGQIQDWSVYENKFFVLKLVENSITDGSASFSLYWGRTYNNAPFDGVSPVPSSGNMRTDWSWKYTFTIPAQQVPQSSGLWGPWTSAWPNTIAYPSNFNKASLQSIESAAQTYRGEVNSQLQLYLQSTQARQSNIETSMKNMQNLVSQTTQAVTNMINTLDTFMQTLTSILSALFH